MERATSPTKFANALNYGRSLALIPDKIFDKNSRLIKRHKFPELIQSGRTMAETSLVVLNAEGDAIVLTEEFERELFRILKKRYS